MIASERRHIYSVVYELKMDFILMFSFVFVFSVRHTIRYAETCTMYAMYKYFEQKKNGCRQNQRFRSQFSSQLAKSII